MVQFLQLFHILARFNVINDSFEVESDVWVKEIPKQMGPAIIENIFGTANQEHQDHCLEVLDIAG